MDRERYRARYHTETNIEKLGNLVNAGSTASAPRELVFQDGTGKSVKTSLEANGKDRLVCVLFADSTPATPDVAHRQTFTSRDQCHFRS